MVIFSQVVSSPLRSPPTLCGGRGRMKVGVKNTDIKERGYEKRRTDFTAGKI